MLKSLFLFVTLFFITTTIQSQNETPKLVVGIVVDQMRYDYLTRFYDMVKVASSE